MSANDPITHSAPVIPDKLQTWLNIVHSPQVVGNTDSVTRRRDRAAGQGAH